MLEDVYGYAEMIRAAGPRPPRNPDACLGRGYACDYISVCVGEASIDDERLFKIRRRDEAPSVATPKEMEVEIW
jgi:hypothetical protein